MKPFDVINVHVRNLERLPLDHQNLPKSELAGQQALAHRLGLRRAFFWRPCHREQFRGGERFGKHGDLRGAWIDRRGVGIQELNAQTRHLLFRQSHRLGTTSMFQRPAGHRLCFAIHINRVVLKTLQQWTRGARVIDDLSGFDRLVPLQLKRTVLRIADGPVGDIGRVIGGEQTVGSKLPPKSGTELAAHRNFGPDRQIRGQVPVRSECHTVVDRP